MKVFAPIMCQIASGNLTDMRGWVRRLFAPILVMATVAASSSAQEFRTLSVNEYVDKMKAGWLGQMVGAGLGKPTEFRFMGEITPSDRLPMWRAEMVNQFDHNNLYVEMTFLRTIEEHGLSVSDRQVGIDFANTRYHLRRGNATARNLLRSGVAPPDSGHPKFNSHADDIDDPSEGDYAGLISPGLPNNVIKLGDVFGRMIGFDGALYGGLFVGGMYAEAFFTTNVERIVRAGLSCVPEGSHTHAAITDVLRWHEENPTDCRSTWELVNQKYHKNPEYRPYSDTKDRMVAKVYGACIALGLLYGNGDVDKTMAIAMQCGSGQDADFTPSNAAGVLFAAMGYSKLPERFTAALDEETQFLGSPYNLQQLVGVCEKLARQGVLNSGGRIERDDDGNEIFVIPVEGAKAGAPENCWDPGPIAGGRFSQDELKCILPGADASKLTDVNEAIAQFAPGWRVLGCSDDMVPGLYGKRRGKTGVLLTHPLDQNTPCVLSRRIKISSGVRTTLRVAVGHHVQGDWKLVVKVDGTEVLQTDVGPEQTDNTWMDVEVDRSPYAGDEIVLDLVNQPNGWAWEAAYWNGLQIITEKPRSVISAY